MYDIKDARGVPVSAGVPPIVRWSAIVGVILIFVFVGMVIASSNFHHIWPSSDTLRIKLD